MAKFLKAALLGGLIGGAIDIGYAMTTSYINSGMMPDTLLRIVAAGLLGRDVIANGGAAESALGAALHFGICIAFALAFCLVSLVIPALRRWWFITGPVYGAGIYVFMNYLVLPLSALAVTKHPEGMHMVGELASHVLGVGLAISGMARRVMGRN